MSEDPARSSGLDSRVSGAAPVIPDGLDAVLVLLRHGQTQFIVEDRFQGAMEAPLTVLGELQATLAGRAIAAAQGEASPPIPDGAPFAVVHSPLVRARRSAELAVGAMAAAGRAAPPLRADEGFCEIGQGDWEGLTEHEIGARFGDTLAGWRRWPTKFQAPGGESLQAVAARVDASLATLLRSMAAGAPAGTHDRSQVLGYGDAAPDLRRWSLVVGHGGVFRVVMCALLGLSLDHFWNFDFGLGAISVVELRAGRAVLRTLNFEAHLAGEARLEPAESRERDDSGAL